MLRAALGEVPSGSNLEDIGAAPAERLIEIASEHLVLPVLASAIGQQAAIAAVVSRDARAFLDQILAANREMNRCLVGQLQEIGDSML